MDFKEAIGSDAKQQAFGLAGVPPMAFLFPRPGLQKMAIIRINKAPLAATASQAAEQILPVESAQVTQPKKSKATHTKRRPYDRANLLKPGRLKTGEMLDLYSVSHSTFYRHLAEGIIPKPDGHILNRPYWLTATVAPHFVGAQAA